VLIKLKESIFSVCSGESVGTNFYDKKRLSSAKAIASKLFHRENLKQKNGATRGPVFTAVF
jgi:hypothetical protein